MTIIDQRILIPAGPEVVWEQLSDIANNPKWQADCKSVSFLTSLREGPGMRWRTTSASGHEYVLEITAWYDRIGYEYIYVDGVPYRENKGRVRLQEIAEGTVVQWTFTYEMPGLVGGLRNSLGIKRQIENTMIDSLKSLWRHVNQSGGSQPFHTAKSLMRDAIDYEKRAQYKPRHPSAVSDRREDMISEQVLFEPPIAEDDTRPRPAVAEAPTPEKEPDFLTDVPASESPIIEEKRSTPEVPVVDMVAPDTAPVQIKPEKVDAIPEPVEKSVIADWPLESDLTPLMGKRDTPLMSAVKPTPLAENEPDKLDTGKISIWEVFGVPRPSETQEIIPVKDEAVAATAPPLEPLAIEKATEGPAFTESSAPPSIVVDPNPPPPLSSAPPSIILESSAQPSIVVDIPTKTPVVMTPIGLRIVMRRKLVKLRRRA
jgi:uncharacterized membrane protein